MTTGYLALNLDFLMEYKDYYIKGALMTLELSFFTVIFGSIIGIMLSLMRLSKFWLLRIIAVSYIEFIRGTPLLVQLFMIIYGLPMMINWMLTGIGLSEISPPPDFTLAVVALSINSAAYVAEIFRAGIQAVDKGQMEAARSLGMPQGMAMRLIVLPQAFRNILPALGNEFVVIIKESSQVMVIGIAELMYNANTVRGITYMPFTPLIVAAVIYFLMTFTLSKLLGVAERRLKTSD